MKNKFIFIISITLLITILCVVAFGCTSFSPIVGKWQYVGNTDTIEFTSGGDVIIKSGTNLLTGKYELIGSDVVKLRLEGFAGGWMSLFGGDTWQYEISGDTMTVSVGGKSSVLKRSSN